MNDDRRITRRTALGVAAGATVGLLVHGASADASAHEWFIRGAERFRHLTKASNAQARRWFEEAIRLDPQFARAYANLAATYRMDWQYEWVPDPAAAEVTALDLARKSVALNPDLPYGHQQLSFIYNYRHWHEAAIDEARQAIITGGPSYADGPGCLALALTYAGRPAEATLAAQQAIALDEHVAVYHYYLGQAYYVQGHYHKYPESHSERAREAFRAAVVPLLRARALQPRHRPCHSYLCASYVELGRIQDARDLWRQGPDMPGLLDISARRSHAPHRERWIAQQYITALRVAAGLAEV